MCIPSQQTNDKFRELEEAINRELRSQVRLAELYKEKAASGDEKVTELVSAVTELQTHIGPISEGKLRL